MTSTLYRRIYALVALIPSGRVAGYGQLAAFLTRCGARQVGYALAATPDELELPWHRVVNARGEISLRAGDGGQIQRQRLAQEGVVFDSRGRIDLGRYGWEGPDWQWLEQHGYRLFPD